MISFYIIYKNIPESIQITNINGAISAERVSHGSYQNHYKDFCLSLWFIDKRNN